MRVLLLLLLLALCSSAEIRAQQEQIILVYADSLIGLGPTQSGVREFVGNVHFKQGDVTVKCDRAIHYTSENRADLFGNVVVRQGALIMRSPTATYDGNSHMARADGGVIVQDSSTRLTARRGTYSTETHIATFRDSVKVVDDTMTLWSDRAVYERESRISRASGRVVAYDTIRRAVIRGDSLFHNPSAEYVLITGDAAVWQWDSTVVDTVVPDTSYLVADQIEMFKVPDERYIATGRVELVNGQVAARADSVNHSAQTGLFEFFVDPVVWADSTQLLADTIYVLAPQDILNEIIGLNRAIMVSRSDTARPDRYDQISGRIVTMYIEDDTVRRLVAAEEARSITWRLEEDTPEGLAKFASDTIKAEFEGGSPVDIYWLGGVAGEHHPENVVTGKAPTYRLEGFDWRLDKPTMPPTARPFTPPVPRTPLVGRAGGEVRSTSKKKQ